MGNCAIARIPMSSSVPTMVPTNTCLLWSLLLPTIRLNLPLTWFQFPASPSQRKLASQGGDPSSDVRRCFRGHLERRQGLTGDCGWDRISSRLFRSWKIGGNLWLCGEKICLSIPLKGSCPMFCSENKYPVTQKVRWMQMVEGLFIDGSSHVPVRPKRIHEIVIRGCSKNLKIEFLEDHLPSGRRRGQVTQMASKKSQIYILFPPPAIDIWSIPKSQLDQFMTCCAGRWLFFFFLSTVWEAQLPWRGRLVRRMPDLSQLLVSATWEVIRWHDCWRGIRVEHASYHDHKYDKYLHLGRLRHVATAWLHHYHGDGWKSMARKTFRREHILHILVLYLHVSGRKRVRVWHGLASLASW